MSKKVLPPQPVAGSNVEKHKILVTGSHGFLGSTFVRHLETLGVPFACYDRNKPAASDCTCIVHFGGLTPNTASAKDDYHAYYKANVDGTRRILDLAKTHLTIRRFVNIGSASEYALTHDTAAEDFPEKPATDYGRAKLEQTSLVRRFAGDSGLTVVNLRIFNVAGLRVRHPPSASSKAPTIFDSTIRQLEEGERVLVSHRGTVRDFVDLDDIMDAVLRAATMPGLSGYELINIASGRPTTLGEVIALCGQMLGREPKIVNTGNKPNISVGDPAKARRLLGWQATTPLSESIRRMLGARTRVLVVGAGEAGHAVMEELTKSGHSGIVVVGIVDDAAAKQGERIATARVVGTTADLPRLIGELSADQVLISAPSVGGELARRVAELLPAGFPIKVLPSLASVLMRKVSLSDLRDIDIADLVGRPLVKVNQNLIAEKTRGKTFLVTGGAGSIGSEIVRQLYSSKAKRVVVFDAWEEGVFNLLAELKAHDLGGPRPELVARIGNIRDRRRLEEVFDSWKFDAVLHAAAYKHVPLMEDNPGEAKKTNVAGTRNLLDAVERHGVKDFVMISTDKAVNPASVMGKSKRSAELLVGSYSRKNSRRRHMIVRFGNVLNSSGSVIPTFVKQIRARQPVTITHPEMTRYFMAIPEAVSLVLMAWVIGKNGQTMVLDMGKPMRILDLALRLIRLHGLEPYKDVPIKIVGIRPGEKLHEELAYGAKLYPSSVSRIFIADKA